MSSRVLTRVLLSVLAGALCGVAVTSAVVAVGEGRGDHDVAAPWAPAEPPARSRAREVLRQWDADRARAWAAGDAEALARLYTPRSVAGARDVAMLRSWTARGARVTGLTTQVLRLQVLADREQRLVLVVTDRVARARAVGLDSPVTLPRDRPTTLRIVMLRSAGRWRVESVSPEPPVRSR